MVWTETSDRPTTLGIKWQFSSLGRRIVYSMLLVSVFFTIVTTTLQLHMLSKKEAARALSAIDTVAAQLVSPLQDALERSDGAVIEALINAIHANSGIDWVQIDTPFAQTWQAGGEDADALRSRSFPLNKTLPTATPEQIGTLHIGIKADQVITRLKSQLLPFLLGNLLKTVLIGMVMLVLFDRLAARHLRRIASELSGANWLDTNRTIKLTRDTSIFPDEIDSILNALETMRQQAQVAYASVSDQARKMTRLNTSLQDAMSEQSDLTRALSHDLIAPINTLDMLLREIVDHGTNLPQIIVEDLLDMQASVARMRSQITAVQSYAALLAKDLSCETLSLDEALDDALYSLHAEIDLSRAHITRDTLPKVHGDHEVLAELFRQLLRNSLTYHVPDRTLNISIRAHSAQDGDTRRGFTIEDSAMGIEPAYQEQIFGLFRRLHAQGDIPGNGLGLPICRKIAERHGGTLSLRSTPGVGTIVTVILKGPRS